MTYGVRPAAWRVLAALVPAALVVAASATVVVAQRAGNGSLPATVDAIYKISFTALGDIGHFHFNSQVSGDTYALTANGKIDTAIFDYRGDMKSRGAVVAAGTGTEPADYTYNYKQKTFLKKKKLKRLNITFNGPAVGTVTPPENLKPPYVLVKPEHLRNVLDPLSGVMALSIGNMANPCAQKLPIYDGKQRFDLVFTPKGKAGTDHVCTVKLVPVSGHKPGEGAGSVLNGDIELVMRPVPNANVVIPYRLTVPTIVGTAELTSERVDITMPDQQRIALRR